MCAIGLLAAFLLRDVTRCTVFAMSHATLMLLLLKLEGTSYGWSLLPAYRPLRFHPALCYRGHPLYRWESRNSGLPPAGHGNRLLPFPAGRVKVRGTRESSPAL